MIHLVDMLLEFLINYSIYWIESSVREENTQKHNCTEMKCKRMTRMSKMLVNSGPVL